MKPIKFVFNAVYSIGVLIVLYSVIVSLFGSNEVVNPDAMFSVTYRERAFFLLVFGTIPMLLACMAVYTLNDVMNRIHKKRNFVFIFLPGFICSVYTLFFLGMLISGK